LNGSLRDKDIPGDTLKDDHRDASKELNGNLKTPVWIILMRKSLCRASGIIELELENEFDDLLDVLLDGLLEVQL